MRGCRRIAAFTLVELLVVIAIIGLIIAIALPSFSGATRQAKERAVQAEINAVDAGLNMYQAERALGGRLPPSSSDITAGSYAGKIVDPTVAGSSNKQPDAYVSGASLLVYALAGPDNQGTAGFRSPAGGPWAEATGGPGTGGLYDPTVTSPAPRYPGNAGTYAGSRLMDNVKALREVKGYPTSYDQPTLNQRVFVDSFGMPILYYRARKAARYMITKPGDSDLIGVYDHRDNSLITGGVPPGSTGGTADGVTPAGQHGIYATDYPTPSDLSKLNASAKPGDTDYLFDEYILDRKSSEANPRPVRPDSYLLISAGFDQVYGTKDDIKNWSN